MLIHVPWYSLVYHARLWMGSLGWHPDCSADASKLFLVQVQMIDINFSLHLSMASFNCVLACRLHITRFLIYHR